jgi:formylglycine-generating enzyme required for sulfatase activity
MKPLRHLLAATLLAACLGATHADDPRVVKDSEGHELLLLKAGEFMMGGAESAQAVVGAFPDARVSASDLADEYPRHKVRITKPFMLAKYEVTVAQFRRFTEATGYRTEAETDGTGG